jgi:hypothetical protein
VHGPRNLVLAFMFIIFAAGFSAASDIYIAQNATGNANGTDCADAYAATWFNNSSNWGPNQGQIGPGTTVHLCGTFNASAGASGYLTPQGNGTNGNPITIYFESGTLMQAPWWGAYGAIGSAGNFSYITVDGGTNGTIQATLDGSPGATCLAGACQYQQNGFAVRLSSCNSCEIKNLTVSDMYIHTATSNDAGGNNGIMLSGNNVSIDNNTIHDTCWAINSDFNSAGTTNINIFNNTLYNIDHGIAVGDSGPGSMLTGLLIYGNVIHDFANWDTAGDFWHHDGVHVFTNNDSSVGTPFMIYNNYVYGNWGQNDNTAFFLEINNSGSTAGAHYIFNNLLVFGGGACANMAINDDTGGTGGTIVNNTMAGNGAGACGLMIGESNSASAVIQNNIYSGNGQSGQIAISNATGGSTISISNYNDFFQVNPNDGMRYNEWYTTVPSWTSGTGFDRNTITSNPNLNANYQPNSGSPVIGAGINLYGTCSGQPVPGLGALCSDHAGNQRPSSGNWDIGAFQYNTSLPPAPPTGLTAVVQ